MNQSTSSRPAPGKDELPGRAIAPGTENAPQEAGVDTGMPRPGHDAPVKPQPISREAAEKALPPDPDPDDPVSP
ncbi:MAG TPA: hypothetical protein VGE12_22050 [Noviherbaspirillum sp.]